MTNSEDLLGVEFVRDCFEYKKGVLFWSKTRPTDHFGRHSDYITFQKKNAGKPAGRIAEDNRINIKFRHNGKAVGLSAHRVIWMLHHGKWSEHDIEHINGNCSDNRIENLREKFNTLLRGRGGRPTGVQGVVARDDGRFQLQIRLGRSLHYAGMYGTVDEAERALHECEALFKVILEHFIRIKSPYSKRKVQK